MIDNMCAKAKKEISERIEIIKAHLDVLHKELLNTLALIKENVSVEVEKLNKQAEQKCSEYKIFADNIEKMLDNFEENKEKLEIEIYECQNYIEDLDLVEQNFHKILRKVAFDPSEWDPDEAFICDYIGKFDIDGDEKQSDDIDSD